MNKRAEFTASLEQSARVFQLWLRARMPQLTSLQVHDPVVEVHQTTHTENYYRTHDTGGADLIFPHHECEAAQSEAATGVPFVRHWVHQGMVRLGGEKMSKSLGNLVFVSDLVKEWDPMAVRVAILANG